jgi:hypothetical protein
MRSVTTLSPDGSWEVRIIDADPRRWSATATPATATRAAARSAAVSAVAATVAAGTGDDVGGTEVAEVPLELVVEQFLERHLDASFVGAAAGSTAARGRGGCPVGRE